jgi:hypothetical protein
MAGGVTEAVELLAAELGLTPVWAQLHQASADPAVLRFVSLAATVQYAGSRGAFEQEAVGDVLDAAKGRGGLTDPEERRWAAVLAAASVELHEARAAALDRAREMVDELLDLGVVQRP